MNKHKDLEDHARAELRRELCPFTRDCSASDYGDDDCCNSTSNENYGECSLYRQFIRERNTRMVERIGRNRIHLSSF